MERALRNDVSTNIRSTLLYSKVAAYAGSDIHFIDMKMDYSFKLLFGTEGNEDLLLMLVNCFIPDKHIVSVRLGTQERVGDRRKKKRVIYDVYCTTDDGTSLILEMQYKDRDDMSDRMLFYSSFPVRDQLSSGADDFNLKPIYVIEILNYTMPDNEKYPDVINYYSILNKKSLVEFTNKLNFVTIELPKFTKTLPELQTLTDKLLFCIRYLDSFCEIPRELVCPELEK